VWDDIGKSAVDWGLMEERTYNSLGYITGQIASSFVVIGEYRE